LLVATLATAFAFCGCSEPAISTMPLASIDVTPLTATIAIGDSAHFSAKLGGGIVDQRVRWSTSDATMLVIDSRGWARALRTGTVVVTAAYVPDSAVKSSALVTIPATP
jgi:uncharacterized protein YjdB